LNPKHKEKKAKDVVHRSALANLTQVPRWNGRLLESLLSKRRKSARVDDRKVVNAIFYVLLKHFLHLLRAVKTLPSSEFAS
jgi:hypothetical protein